MPVPEILWVDDEIENLQSQKMFLENKGYRVHTRMNGHDAIEFVRVHPVDVVLLDESMPGISGLETMARIKEINSQLPVVLITKNETENLMDEAIGAQISDYLIKPVNPNQVLLSLKKIIDNRRLISEKAISQYHQQFSAFGEALDSGPDHNQWMEIYRKLVAWELEIGQSDNPEFLEMLQQQKTEANAAFFKYVSKHYAGWLNPLSEDAPLLSHTLFRHKILPHVEKGIPLIWLVIDNLRLDQWKVIQPLLSNQFRMLEEENYFSILPTATAYCRNALFAGQLPRDIQQRYPEIWKNDDEEGSKNRYEEELFASQLKRLRRDDISFTYQKIMNHQEAQRLVDHAHNLLQTDLSIVVYNFVDMLSHARTEMEVLKELAGDEAGYRSLTASWFLHSPLYQALRKIADRHFMVILTTDHGSVRVNTPCRVIGDRQTTANLRYKHGRNLDYESRDVFAVKDPGTIGLPTPHIHSSYVFTWGDRYLCYPNNYNHYASLYRNSFQHGGISLEEMIVPVIRMQSK